MNKRNLGNIIKFEVHSNHKFRTTFIYFKACNDGFLEGCRPILGLDGCHLKTRFRRVYLATTALDGNYGMFPLAYSAADSKDGDNWKWF